MTGQLHSGGCHCGDIRYEVSGPSVWKAVCYCESCTRIAGAPAVAWAGIERSRFRMLKGCVKYDPENFFRVNQNIRPQA